jgi:hypothetical protein
MLVRLVGADHVESLQVFEQQALSIEVIAHDGVLGRDVPVNT